VTDDLEPREPAVLPLGRYLLDVARASDVDAVEAALGDPGVALWNPGARRPGLTLRDRAKLWVADRAVWTDERATWVVRDPAGALVGQISLHQIDPRNGSAEVGYWLTPAGRGQGLATAALAAAARYAFDALELARVELFHATANDRSCRVALRAGFLLEGTARQSFVYGDGQRHDEHLHARLATDPEPDLAPLA
jgi:RimJ/RimL family protein N-acetyltransferase